MSSTKTKAPQAKIRAARARSGTGVLGIDTDDAVQIVHHVRAGFPFARLARFQKASDLSWEKIARFVGIPQRTLTRRQSQGKLQHQQFLVDEPPPRLR